MRTSLAITSIASAAALALVACSPTEEPTTTTTTTEPAMAKECVPVPGDALVALEDDLFLQNSDNIVPAVNAKTAEDPAVLAALDEVSKVLDTAALVALNKRVDVDFESSTDVAESFVADNGITAPLTSTGKLKVGAQQFSESITLSEVYAVVLRQAGFEVDVVELAGYRDIAMPALIKGDLDVNPEYAAASAKFLNGGDPEGVAFGDITKTYPELVRLGNEQGITFGAYADAQDKNGFATTQAFADEYGIVTLSDLAEACGPVSLGGPIDCDERSDCLLGLEELYGIEISDFSALDGAGPLTKAAIRNGDVILGVLFTSDGTLG